MRQQHGVRRRHDRGIDLWLALEHIKPRPADGAAFQCRDKRILVNDIAARRVDHIGRRRHGCERLPAEDVARLGRCRAMQADKIAGGADLGDTGQLTAADTCPVIDRGPVLEHYLHAEPEMRSVRDSAADPAHADNAERLAGHLPADKMCRAPAAPFTGAKLALALTGAPAQHQHQGERQVGGRIGQHTRRVGHRDPVGRGGGKIDMVHPDPVIGDHPAASLAAGPDHLIVDHVGYGRGGDVMACKPLGKFVLGQWTVILVEGHVEMRGKSLFRGGRPAAGHENGWLCHQAAAFLVFIVKFKIVKFKKGDGRPVSALPSP